MWILITASAWGPVWAYTTVDMTTVFTGNQGRTGGSPESSSGSPEPASDSTGPDTPDMARPTTLRTIERMVERGEKFASLTCYDATTASWLARAGVPLLLVGDTAAEMILGLPGTIHAPLEFLITLTAAVKRGAPNALVMGDMPFMSYQADEAEALRNAGRFMTDGRADIVKLEVDRTYAALVEKMERAGVPVCGHIGSRPQRVKLHGGYRSTGKSASDAVELVADAVALERAGATMLLVEAVPNEVSARIVERTSIPVIGCGAGEACHGQIVVLQDLLGMTSWQPPFAPPIAQIGTGILEAASGWVEKVRTSDLGEHPYTMPPDQQAAFDGAG